MGNKVNPIALRIGQQVNWSNWWNIKKGNNSNTHREELVNYLIINNVVESVLKKNNIFVSDSIVTSWDNKNVLEGKANKINNLKMRTAHNIYEYECWNINFSKQQSFNETAKRIDNYTYNTNTSGTNIDYLVKGLVFNSKTLGKKDLHTQSYEVGKQQSKSTEWGSTSKIYNNYIEKIINSERKSIESTNLLKESYILIEKILKDWLNKM